MARLLWTGNKSWIVKRPAPISSDARAEALSAETDRRRSERLRAVVLHPTPPTLTVSASTFAREWVGVVPRLHFGLGRAASHSQLKT